MLLGLLLQFLLQSLHVVFDLGALLVVNLIYIRSACVVNPLVQDPCAVQANHTLLQFLVRQVSFGDHLVNVVFKSLRNIVLSLNLLLHLLCRFCQSFLAHAQIIHNQYQVLVDSIEVLLLRAHFIGLLVELLNLDLLRANVPLELLDFVIKDELELLQFLDLLLQLRYLNVLFVYRSDACAELLFACVDIGLNLLLLDEFVLELILFLLQVFGFIATLHILRHQLAHVLSQFRLVFHPLLDVQCQRVLVLVRHRVDIFPRVLLRVPPLSHDTLLLAAFVLA